MSERASEFKLIDWIRRHVPAVGGHVTLGIGDDCAALRFAAGREVVVTTDMLMEGRHFHVSEADSLNRIGEKALGVNLSDIAAMAAVPVAAVVAVALSKSRDVAETARRLQTGLTEMAQRFNIALVGGDTNAWEGPLVISVTVLGQATERGIVRRGGAQPGDAIYVTGPLGGSLRDRHLSPSPRVREALALHAAFNLHAMIDISDGLAADLGHILEESGGLGATLDAGAIPLHDDARVLATADGRSPLDHALNDGEDFELCFTLAEPEARLCDQQRSEFGAHRVGVVTAEPGLRLRQPDGRVEPLVPRGFDHFIE